VIDPATATTLDAGATGFDVYAKHQAK